jgi:DNA-binding NarL/FixJ family response regulator
LIVEDEQTVLQCFSAAILSEPGLSLVGVATTGAAAMAMLDGLISDVVLVDLDLPDMSGIKLIRHITRRFTSTAVLVVTTLGDDEHILSSIEAGATGYLLKDRGIQVITKGIHDIRAGGSPISPTIARRVLTRLRSTQHSAAKLPDRRDGSRVLSPREIQILQLIERGLSFDEVATHLQISNHTVVAHVRKVYRKLAVHSRGEAVYEARQLGLL